MAQANGKQYKKANCYRQYVCAGKHLNENNLLLDASQ